MTWPENPGPDEWYLEVAPEESENSRFNRVWIQIKCASFPTHLCNFKLIDITDALRAEFQFDLAMKQARAMIGRLNFIASDEAQKTEDMPCAECGRLAALDDYLCLGCRIER